VTELKLREDGLEWREVEGEVIVLDLDGNVYISLNGTGAVCWHALAEGTTREEMLRRVTTRFDVDEERAAADIDAFLSRLGEQGLLAQAPA